MDTVEMKPLLIITFALLLRMQIADYLSMTGKQLNDLGNLPHRVLGLDYVAHILEPNRTDYTIEYLGSWFSSVNTYMMIEGQRKPIVPLFAGQYASEHLEDPQLLQFSHLFRQWKEDQRKNVKLTMVLKHDGETIEAEIK